MVNAITRRMAQAFVLATCAAVSEQASAQSRVISNVATNAPATGQVRGVVFDSLLMKPVSHATVWVAGSELTTIADTLGRFELSSVPAGTRVISFSSASLDSLGLPTSGRSLEVIGGATNQVALNTPSFRTVWRALCGAATTSGKDSAIVWGTVRDAATLTLQGGAAARFNWIDTRVSKQKEVSFTPQTREVRTDETGTYYACGLPLGILVSSEGVGTKSATGALEYMIGDRRLFRADLLVSTEMVRLNADSSMMTPDSASLVVWRGTATLRGVLRDEKGQPITNATIAVLGSDTTVRSDADGAFQLRNVPAGTQLVQVRQVGFAPVSSLVDMRPAATTMVKLDLNRTVELKPIDVRANRVAPVDRLGYEERKRRGFGFFLESSTFKNARNVGGIVQGLPNVYVRGEAIYMKSGIQNCDPNIYLDGIRSNVAEVAQRSVDAYRAVEVYPHMSAPTQYQGGICGVILFWTWQARW